MQFASNQLLVLRNLEYFYSTTTPILDQIIIPSHCYQSFFTVVEVYLDDRPFMLVNDAHNLGDLLCWVKRVTFIDFVPCASLTSLSIIQSYTKCPYKIPLHFHESEVSQVLHTFVNLCHVWNYHRSCHKFNSSFWNNSFAPFDSLIQLCVFNCLSHVN